MDSFSASKGGSDAASVTGAGKGRPAEQGKRVASIDLLRGLVMIVMALDHVRDYFHGSAYLYNPTDLDHTSVPIFLTRWITHFCAPVFVFLAGISAYLYGEKKGRRALSFFLFTRGLWLVAVEIFIVSPEWTFDLSYSVHILQVIWAIGAGMMILSVLVVLDRRALLFFGILLLGAHNLFDTFHVQGEHLPGVLWTLLHDRGMLHTGPGTFLVGYPILPWVGILVTGYSFGILYTPSFDPARRNKILLACGTGAILLFILLRAGNFYGDHAHWSVQKNTLYSWFSFVNTTKYPPSLLYTLMTLGPALLFLAVAGGFSGGWTKKVLVFGRVPMFYYLLHILLIHLLAMAAVIISGHDWRDMIVKGWVTASPALKGYGFNLLTVYIIWVGVVLTLYPLCKWYDGYKRAHQSKQWWLSYL